MSKKTQCSSYEKQFQLFQNYRASRKQSTVAQFHYCLVVCSLGLFCNTEKVIFRQSKIEKIIQNKNKFTPSETEFVYFDKHLKKVWFENNTLYLIQF